MKRRTYVEMFFPGAMVAESTVRQVASRATCSLDVPMGCWAFQFFDIEHPEAVREDGVTVELDGPRVNVSGMYYPRADVFTLADIERMATYGVGRPTLLDNMRTNGWARVVRSRLGNWQPFNDGDVVLAVHGWRP